MTAKMDKTSALAFWDPVHYGAHAKTLEHKVLQWVDAYFNCGTHRATVLLPPQDHARTYVIFQEHQPTFLLTALKIISYATVIIPAIMLIAKYILRSRNLFYEVRPALTPVIFQPYDSGDVPASTPTSNDPAVGNLLKGYKLGMNAKRYSSIMEQIHSKIPEPDTARLTLLPANLQALGKTEDAERINDEIVNFFQDLINRGFLRSDWEDRLLKMTSAIYDAVMMLEGEELKSAQEILISSLEDAFQNCSNRKSTEIERLYFLYVAPELLTAAQEASTSVETLVFELANYRIEIRDAIINMLCPDQHNAASHRYFRMELNQETFYLPIPPLCAEDNNYEGFAKKRQRSAIIKGFQEKYDNPHIIYDLFIGYMNPKPNEKFLFKPGMFTDWLKATARMDVNVFMDENMTVYKPEIFIAFLNEMGFLEAI